ncbi:hypothetical protein B7463_g2674, partial [Scytalidium lignicola]
MYPVAPGGAHSILSAQSDADHSRYRRLISHGFSEKAMREQEPVATSYIDLLIQRLRERAKHGPQDMVAWYNWTTFDLIGDLTFGESFDCLEKAVYHPWIEFVFSNIKAIMIISILRRFPVVPQILMGLFRKQMEKRAQNAKYTKEKVARRMAMDTDRTDFLSYILRHKGKETEMTIPEIQSTSSILVLGGSETTATLLSGVTYLLLKNPEVLKRLNSEIRGYFSKEEDINMVSVNSQTYLLAVLEEGMRVFPPVPLGSPRISAPEGDTIAGHNIPGGALVIANNYASTHSSRNWKDPFSFVPGRWLNDPRYADDNKSASAPFSLGPRNCIGRNIR